MSSIYIHSRNQSHSSKCALHTRQESLLELYLLIQSLKEAIHSKCNLKVHYGTFSHLPLTYWVHVKFHRMKSASKYTDYTKVYHNSTENQGFQAQSHHINIPTVTLEQLILKGSLYKKYREQTYITFCFASNIIETSSMIWHS